MELVVALALLFFLIALLLVFLYLSVRIVQQYERMVVFRLGRTNEKMVRDPGLRFLIPVVDRPVKVDLRETLTEVPSQTTSSDTVMKIQPSVVMGVFLSPRDCCRRCPRRRRGVASHRTR